jgi:hypothetical protein
MVRDVAIPWSLMDDDNNGDRQPIDRKAWVGSIVRALEFVGPDSEGSPRTLVGVLQCVYVRTLDYDRFSIRGIGVDPLTVELVDT